MCAWFFSSFSFFLWSIDSLRVTKHDIRLCKKFVGGEQDMRKKGGLTYRVCLPGGLGGGGDKRVLPPSSLCFDFVSAILVPATAVETAAGCAPHSHGLKRRSFAL